MVSGGAVGENENGSLSTLGYSTNTSIPESPSSESVSSSGSVSSTVSSTSASSATSLSSSDLGCTAVISDATRELENRNSAPCQTSGLLPTPCHTSPTNEDNLETTEHQRQQQQHQRHHHHHYHHNRNAAPLTPSPPTSSAVTCQPQQSTDQQHRVKPTAHMNLATLLHRHECLGEQWPSKKVLFTPETIRSGRKLQYCPCRCHHQSALTKSSSLKLNTLVNRQIAQSEATRNESIDNKKACTDGNESALNMSGDVDAPAMCDRGCDRQKAHSFDPFAVGPCPAIKPRQPTPVRFTTNQMHLPTSQSSQNCRRPTGNLPKSWRHGTNRPHGARLKSCLKSLPCASEQITGGSYLSYSDEDATEVLCYLSDDERHRIDDATSATLSATESPGFSSASSYSFSTSSLDAQVEEVCTYYHHWYAPSCTPNQLVFREPERARRGGSLDPSASIQRLPGMLRQKRSSQPSSHRSFHRKRSLELHSLQSNPSHCPCIQQHPCVCCTLDGHGHVHPFKALGAVGLHQSLEGNRQIRSNRHTKIRQLVSMNSAPPEIPICTRLHHVHENGDADAGGNKNSTKHSSSHESKTHRSQLQPYSHQRNHQRHHHHHRHHRHPHHKRQTTVSNVTGRPLSSVGTKPPVAKRKSNELRELAASESGMHVTENLPRMNSSKAEGNLSMENSPAATTATARCGSAAEVLLRPRNLQLDGHPCEQTNRSGSSLQSVGDC